jgi:hypothetical protein
MFIINNTYYQQAEDIGDDFEETCPGQVYGLHYPMVWPLSPTLHHTSSNNQFQLPYVHH